MCSVSSYICSLHAIRGTWGQQLGILALGSWLCQLPAGRGGSEDGLAVVSSSLTWRSWYVHSWFLSKEEKILASLRMKKS